MLILLGYLAHSSIHPSLFGYLAFYGVGSIKRLYTKTVPDSFIHS